MDHNILQLPQVTVRFSADMPQHDICLIGGGRQPEQAWLQAVISQRQTWCIDHGLDSCYQLQHVPELVLGDGDSATKAAWQWALDVQVPLEKHPCEKDDTDTQLALHKAAEENAFIILTGALGGRFDHAFSTIFSFGHSGLSGCIADETEAIFFLKDSSALELLPVQPPKAVSLLPLTSTAQGVSITGVRWPLAQTTLNQAYPYAISNVQTASQMKVSLEKGLLAVYLCWQEAETK